MKITDQGFTERVASQAARTTSTTDTTQPGSSTSTARPASSDNLQLSNLAALLQGASKDDSSRSARVSQIAQAVQNNTFKVDPARVSSSIVSEAIQSSAR